MTFEELLKELFTRQIRLRKNGDELTVRGPENALEPFLVAALRTHKAALLALIGNDNGSWWFPSIPITPDMLPLVDLNAEEIEWIVAAVPGGAANVQDIYPLAPLQDGILFHHLMGKEGDPYLLATLLGFESRTLLDSYLKALQAVIDRHDILRTAVLWEELREPTQVVWRRAAVPVEELLLDEQACNLAEQLYSRFDPRHYRIDVRLAPLLRAYIAEDKEHGRWLMMLLQHHLSCDHTTMELMHEEIQAHLLRHAEQLPVPTPFRSLVAQMRLAPNAEAHEAFFRRMLGDIDEPTAPFGLLDVWGDGTQVEQARLMLGRELARRIRVRARKLGVSPATLFHVTWAQVLARASGREDVVFGTVLSGRMQGGAGTDRMMGHLMNTLPVRIRLGEEKAEVCVRSTHILLGELLEHGHASLATAQRCSRLDARTPLFSALLNYRHSTGEPEAASEEALRAWAGIQVLREEERTNYPLVLQVDDLGEDFLLEAQTSAPVDAKRVCEFMSRALQGLVEALETTSATPVRALPVLPERERQQILYEWNATRMDFSEEKRLHELFEDQVHRTPDAKALVSERSQLTYGELNRRANQLAHHLRGLGVGPDSIIGVCLGRSVEMVVALLGILKAGGAYLPLDPDYPKDRLAFMLGDAEAAVLLTTSSLAGTLPSHRAQLVCFDTDRALLGSQPDTNLPQNTQPENLAYVLYTSGSTGKPKGVEIPHRALVNFLHSMQREPGFTARDTLLAVTTLSFDIAGLELYLPLISGGKLVIASRDDARDPVRLMECIRDSRCTVMQATPATWRALIDAGWDGSKSLRILCGGESLPPELALDLLARCSELWNVYGPTETTIWSSIHKVTAVDGPIPIGHPIANTQFFVLDAHGDLAPPGVIGEMYIGGAGLARGYRHRPELTQERFIPNPLHPSQRLYRTGDLGRWRTDGTLECLGRADNQVKIRGFRVELGEIESTLDQHPAIRQAVVAAREDRMGLKQLVAYLQQSNGSIPSTADLRAYLKEKLPEYMVPSAFVTLDTFPLTPNGKIDRKALPAPSADRTANKKQYVAPRDALEQTLADVWAKVLRVEKIGLHDDFFELGGHSLTAVKLVAELKKHTGRNLPLATLFQASTVEQCADILRKEAWNPSWSSLVPIQPFGSRIPLFLVHGAEGNVLLYRQMARYLGPDQPVYGLQAESLNGDGRSTIRSVESMASHYLREILTVQPHGPFFLGGYCLGGVIALEIAQQLRARGEEVRMVIMLDTYNLSTVSQSNALLQRPLHFVQNVWFHFANAVSIPAGDRKQFFKQKLDVEMARLGVRLRVVLERFRRSGNSQVHDDYPHLLVKRINDEAAVRYKPVSYDGCVVVIRPKGSFLGQASPSLGWDGVVGNGLKIHQLPVYPKGMLVEPFCRALAETVQTCLLEGAAHHKQPERFFSVDHTNATQEPSNMPTARIPG